MSFLATSSGMSAIVAWVLLLMSISTWMVIIWKGLLIGRAMTDISSGTTAFWAAPTLEVSLQRVEGLDRDGWVTPMIQAYLWKSHEGLSGRGDRSGQVTRQLRDALQKQIQRLQEGHTWLATVAATSPFVGLLGTVWGVYQALSGVGDGGQVSIEQLARPIGEALIMTGAGLAVAIPAVLGYNILGRYVSRLEAELDGFARDLHDFNGT